MCSAVVSRELSLLGNPGALSSEARLTQLLMLNTGSSAVSGCVLLEPSKNVIPKRPRSTRGPIVTILPDAHERFDEKVETQHAYTQICPVVI